MLPARMTRSAEVAAKVDRERRSCWRVLLGAAKSLARRAAKLLARLTGSAQVFGEVDWERRSFGQG